MRYIHVIYHRSTDGMRISKKKLCWSSIILVQTPVSDCVHTNAIYQTEVSFDAGERERELLLPSYANVIWCFPLFFFFCVLRLIMRMSACDGVYKVKGRIQPVFNVSYVRYVFKESDVQLCSVCCWHSVLFSSQNLLNRYEL